jgi:hypothetical protein
MAFNNYIEKKSLDISRFSTEFVSYLEKCYNKFHINLAPFISSPDRSEEQIFLQLNDELRRQHRIQFHNVGKDALKRYYAYQGHYAWLKLEHLLIQHIYAISKNRSKKSQTRISNKKIAIGLGWLNANENDPEVIKKALRKVTDNLNILKNERGTFKVEHKHNYNKKGSYHLITADWLRILELYTSYDPKTKGSIRFRKSIKYRIISLIKTSLKRAYSNLLRDLMDAQKNRYLKDLISFDLYGFKDVMLFLKYVFNKMRIDIPESMFNTNNIVPNYKHPELELTIKTKWIQTQLKKHSYLAREFKEKYDMNLTILANL